MKRSLTEIKPRSLKNPSTARTTGVLLALAVGRTAAEPVQWVDLGVGPAEMRPSFTLATGQCFHWRQLASDLWAGVLGPYALAVRETDSTSHVALLGSLRPPSLSPEEEVSERQLLLDVLHSYFQLGEKFADLFEYVRLIYISCDLRLT